VDVIIIGGGLIGLSSAYELAKRGANVRVVDAHERRKPASWASAGILSPYIDHIPSPKLEGLCSDSLACYPSFVDGLRTYSDIDPWLRIEGNLKTLVNDEDVATARARITELCSRGFHAYYLDAQEARSAEPRLGPNVVGAMIVEEEGQIESRRLLRALSAACLTLGVDIAPIDAHAVRIDKGYVCGVDTSDGFIPASIVINAAGAWASQIDGLPEDVRVPVEPVKGQMLALTMPNDFVRQVVWFSTGAKGYAVPRNDGRLLIGATMERVGFDLRVTAQGLRALLDAALAVLPSLRDFAVVETWAGLRPESSDGAPVIGATSLHGYILATGHFRYGVLLTPISARLIADTVEGRPLPAYAEAFSPKRFAAPVYP
jgi:glycine oxidase